MKLLVSALETSSNIHLKEVLKHLKDYELLGIFDKSIAKPTFDISELAVMGFVDVIKKLPFFLKLNKQMVHLAKDVDIVLLIDGSGFNLPLAKKIKKKYPDKKIIYYILPQAWAWKKRRIPVIERNCDRLCSILPFEKEYYNQKDKIVYVGHPLLDEIKIFKEKINNSNKVVFMPGSRIGEIKALMPIFKEVSIELKKEYELVLIIPKHFSRNIIDEVYGNIEDFTISNDAHNELFSAKFAFICSGTATLEAALIGTPFVLTYVAKKIDYFIAKILVRLEYVGLANIFFHKMGLGNFHKELLQQKVTKENLIKSFYESKEDTFLEKSKILRQYLKYGSSYNVANIIKNFSI